MVSNLDPVSMIFFSLFYNYLITSAKYLSDTIINIYKNYNNFYIENILTYRGTQKDEADNHTIPRSSKAKGLFIIPMTLFNSFGENFLVTLGLLFVFDNYCLTMN